jgi:hypothetical protein
VAKLTAEEQAQLDALLGKKKAPERTRPNHTLSVSIDLGDPEQVKRAQKLGFLDPDEDEEGAADEGDDEDEDAGDEIPKRRGYFPDE